MTVELKKLAVYHVSRNGKLPIYYWNIDKMVDYCRFVMVLKMQTAGFSEMLGSTYKFA
jgi:hypothetical protein